MMSIVDTLLKSDEPSIRYKVRVGVLGEDPESRAIKRLRTEIRNSPRVRALLRNRDNRGRIEPVRHVYQKWTGAHWVFPRLADIGYPPGGKELFPIRDQVFDCWLHPEGIEEHVLDKRPPRHKDRGVPIIRGRARRCASQQSNALYAAVTLGLCDERCDQLANLLIRWQWPDGGWNCDRRAEASKSSFWESWLPLRALSAYARVSGSTKARQAAKRTAELFLKRHLFRRQRDGGVMNPQFVQLHYPCYWRYDILCGLKVMAEARFIADKRCAEALDLLESKRLPDGGWRAEACFYGTGKSRKSDLELVSWGGVSKSRMNEWVTADALYVLRAAGRPA